MSFAFLPERRRCAPLHSQGPTIRTFQSHSAVWRSERAGEQGCCFKLTRRGSKMQRASHARTSSPEGRVLFCYHLPHPHHLSVEPLCFINAAPHTPTHTRTHPQCAEAHTRAPPRFRTCFHRRLKARGMATPHFLLVHAISTSASAFRQLRHHHGLQHLPRRL